MYYYYTSYISITYVSHITEGTTMTNGRDAYQEGLES